MRQKLIIVALAAAAAVFATVAQAASSAAVIPGYAKRPTAQDFAELYPPAALSRGKSGSARIQCSLDPGGHPTDCTVLSEDPPGLGFGAASLRMAQRFLIRLPPQDQASAKRPTWATTIHWRLGS